MKTDEINIRDPYVLLYEGSYYLYGTRAATCWGEADGFDCYISQDLKEWRGPYEVFHKPKGFWADRNCWAPEVHLYRGSFYMFATFKDTKLHGGTQILKADNPLGPFTEHSDRQVTPRDWECLDGTFYVSPNGRPYMVFCHEWVQIGDGTICAVELEEDLSGPAGEPFVLFHASEAKPWVRPHINQKRPGDSFVTDGPFFYRTQGGRLLLLWSSFGEEGYAQAVAYSESQDIEGPWIQEKTPLFGRDGGHGMLFHTKEGGLCLTLHSPNTTLEERPVFYPLEEREDKLIWLSTENN